MSDIILLPPEQDVKNRQPVWDAMQMMFMDTDIECEIDYIVKICAKSVYSIDDLKKIYWNELFPVLKYNLQCVAGEWSGIDIETLTEFVIKIHRFGKRPPFEFLHPSLTKDWKRLARLIKNKRLNS